MPIEANAEWDSDGAVEDPDDPADEPGDETGDAAESGATTLPAYQFADFPNGHKCEPHEVPVGKMATFVQKIVDIEGPVHQEEVGRRVAALFGKQRAGGRIAEHAVQALRYLKRRDGGYRERDGFWFTAEQEANPPLRRRGDAPLTLRRADMIPPLEIAAAIRQVLTENGAIPEPEVPRAVALLFGFLRTGPEFKPAVEPVIATLKAAGEIAEGAAGLALNK